MTATKYWSWGPFNGTKYYEYTATDAEKASAPRSIGNFNATKISFDIFLLIYTFYLSIDWTLKGFDKPVQNQGGCGLV